MSLLFEITILAIALAATAGGLYAAAMFQFACYQCGNFTPYTECHKCGCKSPH